MDTAALPPLPPFRLATAADVPALARLYTQAAERMGPQVYSPEQVTAWASFGRSGDAFGQYVLSAQTWVADAAGGPLGFCGIDGAGDVHSLYVHPDHGRRGLGTRLLAHALRHARAQGVQALAAWATPFSKPVFERQGFRLVEVRSEPYQGIVFDRFRMQTP